MSIKCMLLTLCTLGVSLSLNDDNVENEVFDQYLYENVLDPKLCQKQLKDMKTFEFYDASFCVPQSILKGNFASMGNYHQCLGINQDIEGDKIEGKYCMIVANSQDYIAFPILTGTSWLKDIKWAELNINSTIKTLKDYKKTMRIGHEVKRQRKWVDGIMIFNEIEFSLALCIPKSCSVDEALAPLFEQEDTKFDYDEQFCRLPGDKPLAAADYVAIVIFSVIGILTTMSTAYDIRHTFFLKKDHFETNDVLRCCSLYRNTVNFLTFRKTPGAIDCLDGIRALSIIWVVLGHTFIYNFSKYTANIADLVEWANTPRNIWITSFGELSVDTFFVLSGLLLVYTSTMKIKQMQLLKNLHVFYLNRLLRMFPLLACAVLLQASLFHHVSDGVDWQYMGYFVQMCREHWQSALLHIQNITNPTHFCLPQSWYLAVDVQLYILSPLILFWVLGSRRAAWTALALGVGVLWIASTIFIFLKDFSTGYNTEVFYYQNPLTRSPPFLVGMVFGYVLHIFRGKKLRLPLWSVVFGYIAVSSLILYSLYYLYSDGESEIVFNINQSLVRPCWGLSVCLIIFACAHGYGGLISDWTSTEGGCDSSVTEGVGGTHHLRTKQTRNNYNRTALTGPINWFLSLRMWKFIARLSYAMFLLHYSIILTIGSSRVTSFYFSVKNFFLVFASVMVYTLLASVAACVLIDGPCSALHQMMFNGKKSAIPSATSTTNAKSRTVEPETEITHQNLI